MTDLRNGKLVVQFGAYKGERFRDLPETYLYFIARQSSGFGKLCRAEIDRRRALRGEKPRWPVNRV